MKKIRWDIFGGILLIFLACISIIVTICHDNQAADAFLLNASFQGEYKVGDGTWKPIVKGEHIPACQGDVALKGFFQMEFPNGEVVGPVEPGARVALYFNHVGADVFLNGEKQLTFDAENPLIGEIACSRHWMVYQCVGTEQDIIEIVIKNPHKYGNECAIDDLLNSLSMFEDDVFREQVAEHGEKQRIIGSIVIFTALILIGVALFSALIQLKLSKFIWMVGLVILFAGIYLVVSAVNLFDNDNIAVTTALYLLSMMLYVFFFQLLVFQSLAKKITKPACFVVAVSGVLTGGFLLYAMLPGVKLYDMLSYWAIAQAIVSVVLGAFCFVHFRYAKNSIKAIRMIFAVAQVALLADMFATWKGYWQGGLCSELIFGILFLWALVWGVRELPRSIRATLREKEMQVELEKSKTAVMLSQMQPHFLYNSLGAIHELCHQDPEDARSALNTFIVYLRGNMESLQKEHSIHFSKELEHISAYLQLEQMRFGEDLKVVYDLQMTDFFVPSLTVQPLVENAVKHGICGREEGGTVTLHTHREDGKIIIQITDDGVGFDVKQLVGKNHIGLSNVRSRLKNLVNGKLEIESQIGCGTTVTITMDTEMG